MGAAPEARFGDEARPHRIKMAELPQGCELVPNPYNRIPGFSIKRHYFLPGFPDMAHPMAAWVLDSYYAAGAPPERQCALRVRGVPESGLMDLMQQLTERFPESKLFSLPRLGASPPIGTPVASAAAIQSSRASNSSG